MNRSGGEGSQRLGAFVSLARRPKWDFPRMHRGMLWQRLEIARSVPTRRWGRSLVLWPRAGGYLLTFRKVSLVAVAAMAVVAALRLTKHQAGAPPWHQDVELASAGQGTAFASGSLEGPGELAFSDGTGVGVMTDSRVKLDAVTARGADIRLVRGALDARVRPHRNGVWLFRAGPFSVEVKGTSFRLEWEPGEGRMSLDMRSGTVVVRRGGMGAPMTVRGGESLVLTRSQGASAWSEAARDPEGIPAARPAVQVPGASRASSSSQGHTRNHAVNHKRVRERRAGRESTAARGSWPGLLAEGNFATIVEQAKERGIGTLLDHGSEIDIATFADAARYTGQNRLARGALLALRARFPGGQGARSGAFFLARLDEANEGRVESAIAWYDRYLLESPRGAYAEGALAREMVLLRQHRSRGSAQAMAQRYLNEYPEGTYRDLALRVGDPEEQ